MITQFRFFLQFSIWQVWEIYLAVQKVDFALLSSVH